MLGITPNLVGASSKTDGGTGSTPFIQVKEIGETGGTFSSTSTDIDNSLSFTPNCIIDIVPQNSDSINLCPAGTDSDNDSVASEVSIPSLDSYDNQESLDNNNPEVIIKEANRLLGFIEELLDIADILPDILVKIVEISTETDNYATEKEYNDCSLLYDQVSGLLIEVVPKVKEEISKLDPFLIDPSLWLRQCPDFASLFQHFNNTWKPILSRLETYYKMPIAQTPATYLPLTLL